MKAEVQLRCFFMNKLSIRIGILVILIFLIESASIAQSVNEPKSILLVSKSNNRNLLEIDSKASVSIDITPNAIVIWENAGWINAAANFDWCSGSGTSNDPYIISNVITDTSGSDAPCIKVHDTDVHFIIQNCEFTNTESATIHLEWVKNGKLINNSCNSGQLDIHETENLLISSNNLKCKTYFDNCTNNEVSENTINSPSIGIHLDNLSEENIILKNTIRDSGMGISLTNASIKNIIKDNVIENGAQAGISLAYQCNSNEITGNTIQRKTGSGIQLREECNDNNISFNVANYNDRHGIAIAQNSNNNLIIGNTVLGNALGCIFVENTCEGNTLQNNGICLYPFDRHLPLLIGLVLVVVFIIITILIVLIRKRKKRPD